MKRKVKAGILSLIDSVFVRDTSQTSKVAGLTGLAFNSAGMTLYYKRAGDATWTAVSMSAGTIGTWGSGTFVETDATHAQGDYEIGIPNAAVAAGAPRVSFRLHGATNMEEVAWEYELDAVDYQDSVRFGLTALPSAAVGSGANSFNFDGSGNISANAKAINSVSTSSVTTVSAVIGTTQALTFDANNLPKVDVEDFGGAAGTFTSGRPTVQAINGVTFPANFSSLGISAGGAINTVSAIAANAIAAASFATGSCAPLATAVWQDTTVGDFTVASSIGKSLYTSGAVPGASGGLFIAGSNAATTYSSLTVSGALLVSGGTTFTNAAGSGFTCSSTGSNGNGITATGNGTGDGFSPTGGATGRGIHAVGGGTSGEAFRLETTSGDALALLPTAGNGLTATANGLSKHGIVATGGTSGTSDGIKGVAGSGGADIRGNITGNITGTVATVTSLTNAPTSGDFTAAMKTSLGTAVGTAQSGDSYARLGAPVGASISADIQTRLAASSYTAPDNADIATILATIQAGVSLTVSERNSVAAALLDLANAVGNHTVREILRLAASALGGKTTGGGTHFRDLADTKDVIVVAPSGSDRGTVTLNLS